MKLNVLKLQAKGWSEQEIEHAKEILQNAENNKHPKIAFLEKTIYWILIILAFIGAIIGTWIIQPFLIFLSREGGMLIILIFGIIFGSIVSVLMKDVENIELHHHLIISLIIPVTSIITSIIITTQLKTLTEITNISQHNPFILGIMYSIGSLIPFAILLWYERSEEDGTF